MDVTAARAAIALSGAPSPLRRFTARAHLRVDSHTAGRVGPRSVESTVDRVNQNTSHKRATGRWAFQQGRLRWRSSIILVGGAGSPDMGSTFSCAMRSAAACMQAQVSQHHSSEAPPRPLAPRIGCAAVFPAAWRWRGIGRPWGGATHTRTLKLTHLPMPCTPPCRLPYNNAVPRNDVSMLLCSDGHQARRWWCAFSKLTNFMCACAPPQRTCTMCVIVSTRRSA
jgi:hypothetical protein